MIDEGKTKSVVSSSENKAIQEINAVFHRVMQDTEGGEVVLFVWIPEKGTKRRRMQVVREEYQTYGAGLSIMPSDW